jgi:RNA polymerase-binding transcription factor DksA
VDPDRARNLLTSELADLDERARAVAENRADAAADPLGQEGALGQHPGDYGSEVNTTMEAELSVETVAEQRRRVAEALDRLDGGSYGRCAVCGRPIDDERLEARPEVSTCREHADTPVVT